jgi:hypothetical protein
MINNLEIITTSFKEIERLLENNYIPISVVGKVYGNYRSKEKVERIRGLNTFRNYHNERTGDFIACSLLYQDNLKRIGLNRITSTFIKLSKTHNKTKIALCGHGIKQGFCYRHILREFLISNNIPVTDNEKIDIQLQKELWRHDEYKLRGHYNLTNEFVGQTLEQCNWVFAKTMPNNPHTYTLRRDMGDDQLFLKIASHIRYFGELEIFEGVMYRVFYCNNYRYWEHPCDIKNEDVDLINRAILV